MKKILALCAAAVLMGAGCASSQTAETPVNPPAPQLQVQIEGENADGVVVTPSVGTPVIGGTETVDDMKARAGAEAPVEVTVTYTADGAFSPDSLSLPLGAKVTWTNAGDKPLRVASNPHPSHTDYPGFDSMTAIAPGQSWTFTFDKAGTWKYHNHVSPGVGGTVIVTP